MKHLLTTLCLSAAVFSAVAITTPAHALPQGFNPNLIATGLGGQLFIPPVKAPKAELVMTSWISGKGTIYQVNFLVQNTGDVDSGVFTTRMLLRYPYLSHYMVHDVKMSIPARGYRLITYRAYSNIGVRFITSRSTADIFNEVPEHDEKNNSSRINLSQ